MKKALLDATATLFPFANTTVISDVTNSSFLFEWSHQCFSVINTDGLHHQLLSDSLLTPAFLLVWSETPSQNLSTCAWLHEEFKGDCVCNSSYLLQTKGKHLHRRNEHNLQDSSQESTLWQPARLWKVYYYNRLGSGKRPIIKYLKMRKELSRARTPLQTQRHSVIYSKHFCQRAKLYGQNGSLQRGQRKVPRNKSLNRLHGYTAEATRP